MEFVAFPKIPRLSRDMVITEKLDGTNAQVVVTEDAQVLAGSRNRWITPGDDNYGFAKWVREHEDELRVGLGIGTHYGEWWGAGIGRKYGLTEKRFSLFNTARWVEGITPPCCSVVPVLYEGHFSERQVEIALQILDMQGSKAAPGFMKPEGIVIYHKASGMMFKKTIEGDAKPKGSKEVG